MADNELKELLQTVIRGELEPIQKQLVGLQNQQKQTDVAMKQMEGTMNRGFADLHKSIEASDRNNITSDELLLKHILELKTVVTEKITEHEHHFNIINNRLFYLESDVDRLKSNKMV